MRTHMVVLVLDVEEGDGHPADWPWSEIVDTPHALSVVTHAELNPEVTDDMVATFVTLSNGYRDAVMGSVGVKE